MVHLKDIVKATGFSKGTVSKALNGYSDINEQTKETILKKAKELGYIANAHARALATNKSYTIGIILDQVYGTGLLDPFYSALVHAFKNEVEAEGYEIRFIASELVNTNIKSYLDHCIQSNVDGLFIACTRMSQLDLKQIQESNIPLVYASGVMEGMNSVCSDDFQGAYEAVKYLHQLGYNRIGHILGNEGIHSGRERKRGYIEALKDFNLLIDTSVISKSTDYTWQDGYDQMCQLLQQKNIPRAIFAASDLLALGAIRAIVNNGLSVPDDISIIGFDHIAMADYITPQLTTVGQNYEQLAKESARILMTSINKERHSSEKIIVPTNIVEGDTCQKYVSKS